MLRKNNKDKIINNYLDTHLVLNNNKNNYNNNSSYNKSNNYNRSNSNKYNNNLRVY
jgi:hypothetical protein